MLASAVDVWKETAAVSVCRAATVLIASAVGVGEKAEVLAVDRVVETSGVDETAPAVPICVGCDPAVAEAGGTGVFCLTGGRVAVLAGLGVAVFFGADGAFAFFVFVGGFSANTRSTFSVPEFTVLACTGMESAPIKSSIPNTIWSDVSLDVCILQIGREKKYKVTNPPFQRRKAARLSRLLI